MEGFFVGALVFVILVVAIRVAAAAVKGCLILAVIAAIVWALGYVAGALH